MSSITWSEYGGLNSGKGALAWSRCAIPEGIGCIGLELSCGGIGPVSVFYDTQAQTAAFVMGWHLGNLNQRELRTALRHV